MNFANPEQLRILIFSCEKKKKKNFFLIFWEFLEKNFWQVLPNLS